GIAASCACCPDATSAGVPGSTTSVAEERDGALHVHEFMSLDGVIDAPTWTFDHGFDPHMGEAIGAVTARPRGSRLAVGTEKPRKCVPGSLQTVSGGSVDDVAVVIGSWWAPSPSSVWKPAIGVPRR